MDFEGPRPDEPAPLEEGADEKAESAQVTGLTPDKLARAARHLLRLAVEFQRLRGTPDPTWFEVAPDPLGETERRELIEKAWQRAGTQARLERVVEQLLLDDRRRRGFRADARLVHLIDALHARRERWLEAPPSSLELRLLTFDVCIKLDLRPELDNLEKFQRAMTAPRAEAEEILDETLASSREVVMTAVGTLRGRSLGHVEGLDRALKGKGRGALRTGMMWTLPLDRYPGTGALARYAAGLAGAAPFLHVLDRFLPTFQRLADDVVQSAVRRVPIRPRTMEGAMGVFLDAIPAPVRSLLKLMPAPVAAAANELREAVLATDWEPVALDFLDESARTLAAHLRLSTQDVLGPRPRWQASEIRAGRSPTRS